MTDSHPLAAPQFAGYRVEHLIGRGGMGEVYRAVDIRLDRTVALKVLAPRVAGDERFRGRLLQESRLAASLDHPNVVPIFEAGDEDGRLFIAMRFVGGRDLGLLLRREGRLEPARTLAIARQLAGALDAANRRGLVHRDVKPSNVLVDLEDGREHCYLADFGLTQSATDRTRADGQFAGTVAYVAPEQIRGDAVTGRADQYALACLVFECLTGTVPYDRRSDVATLFAHLEEPVPAVSERHPGLPTAVDAVLARGMAKEPDERFEDCAALVAATASGLGLDAPARRPRALRVLVPALVALLVVAVAAVTLALRGGGDAAAAAATGALVRIDPATDEVAARVPVRGHPGEIVASPGGLWMADFRDGVLWRYRPRTGAVEKLTSNGEPRDLAVVGDNVYVAADGRFLSGVVSRYDAVTGVREDGIDLLACAVASDGRSLWAAGCPFVQRLSTGDGRLRVVKEVFVPYNEPATVENTRGQIRELAVGAGSLWVLGDALDRRMWRLDARTGKLRGVVELGFPPTSVAVAAGRVWVTDGVGDRVVVFDAGDSHRLGAIAVGRGASGIAAGAGAIWVTNTLAGTVSRVDPARARVVATIDVGGAPRGIAAGSGGVWVTEHAF